MSCRGLGGCCNDERHEHCAAENAGKPLNWSHGTSPRCIVSQLCSHVRPPQFTLSKARICDISVRHFPTLPNTEVLTLGKTAQADQNSWFATCLYQYHDVISPRVIILLLERSLDEGLTFPEVSIVT